MLKVRGCNMALTLLLAMGNTGQELTPASISATATSINFLRYSVKHIGGHSLLT